MREICRGWGIASGRAAAAFHGPITRPIWASLFLLSPLLGQFTGGAVSVLVQNTSATYVNELACWSGAMAATCAPSASSSGIIGLVVVPAAAGGYSGIVPAGIGTCSFDNTEAVGDYVVASAKAADAGYCHDAGTAYPLGTQAVGIAVSTAFSFSPIFPT